MWGKFLSISSNTFNNRKQIVKYDDVFSDEINVISGCFQGGVLSPTLFNIYTSDIINYVQSPIFTFADDTVLIRPIYSSNDCHLLRTDLNNIYNYCQNNFSKINPDKCKHMRISNKVTDIHRYELNCVEIKNVDYINI